MLYKQLLICTFAFCTLYIFISFPAYAENPNSLAAKAAKEYENNNFESAAMLFEQAAQPETDNYKFNTGLGNSKYRLNDFAAAAEAFGKAALMAEKLQGDSAEINQARADTLYNLGNSLVQLNKLEEAIKNYEKSLEIIPNQEDVVNNLEYAKKLLEEQQKEDNSSAQNSSDDDDNDKQQNSEQDSNDNQQDSPEKNQQNGEDNQNSEQDNDKDNQQGSSDDNQQSNSDEQQDSEQDNASNSQNATDDGKNNIDDNKDNAGNNRDNTEQSEISGETLLNALSENRNAQMNFRRAEALQQIKSSGGKLPERDW